MGYAIIFFANVAISNPSELIERRRRCFVFLIDQSHLKGDNSCAEIIVSCSNIILNLNGFAFSTD